MQRNFAGRDRVAANSPQRYHKGMSVKTPTHPGAEPELDDETKATLDERLKSLDREPKVDAREALNEIRENLKHPAPR